MTKEEREKRMAEAITLDNAMSDLRRLGKRMCLEYINSCLDDAENECIKFYDDDMEPLGGEFCCVTYDGGRHPEYAATPYAFVYAIFRKEDGNIYLRIEDCDEYPIDSINYCEVFDVAHFLYNHL